jgi:lysophospholipase
MAESTGNVPNPFCGFGSGTQNDCNALPTLFLDDGGSNNQNIPFVPLLQPSREVDIIIAVDSSADSTTNWPFGASLNWTNYYASSDRGQSQKIAFPKVNTTSDAIANNPTLIYSPTFFGCTPTDTTLDGVTPPLIVYLPNGPYSAYSNASTLSTALKQFGTVADELIGNGAALATTGILGASEQWKVCLACAVAERSRWRQNIKQSDACVACFNQYCAETKPQVGNLFDAAGNYQPRPLGGVIPGKGTIGYY